jgi:hypothetical protein
MVMISASSTGNQTLIKEIPMFSIRSVLIATITACSLFLSPISSAMAADPKASGKITLDGKPLATGKVTYHLDNGQFIGSKVKDGEYKIDHLPPGKYKVTVEGKVVPATYTSEEKTPLVAEIKDAAVNLDFNLR